MESRDTRQDILNVALNLFSRKGFTAVSIRDICKEVGIKESTVYYHFKNKQDIFDVLMAEFLNIVDGYTKTLKNMIERPDKNLDSLFFEKISETYIEGYLLNDFSNSCIRILNIEQFHNHEAGELYQKWMFDFPLTFQAGVFSHLMKLGVIPQMDSYLMAVHYYAPVFLFYQQYLLSGELTEDKRKLFREHTYRHFAEFMHKGP